MCNAVGESKDKKKGQTRRRGGKKEENGGTRVRDVPERESKGDWEGG